MAGAAYDLVKVRLKLMVLALLAVKPSHGYELTKTIEELTLGAVKAGPGALYPVLRELSSEGLVEEESIVEGGRLRKVYKLTEEGWRELARVIDAAYAVCSSINEVLAAVRERIKSRLGARPRCVPVEVVGYLERLEGRIRRLREFLEELACR